MGQIIEVLEIFVERRRMASHFKGDKDMTSQSVLMWRNMMSSFMVTTTDTACTSTNVTLDPVVDNDSSPNTNGIETCFPQEGKTS